MSARTKTQLLEGCGKMFLCVKRALRTPSPQPKPSRSGVQLKPSGLSHIP